MPVVYRWRWCWRKANWMKKMKVVYQRTSRLAEWETLLTELRTQNARKPRLIEVLDGLAGKRSPILKK